MNRPWKITKESLSKQKKAIQFSKMFSNDDIANYYDSTQEHYEHWWRLKNNFSLHYGIWFENTQSFEESLKNTNQVLLTHSLIKPTDYVLDAGCGVGGAAFYIHEQTGAQVTGISLSSKQISLATQEAKKRYLQDEVRFLQLDFTQTELPAASFDVIWACESVCHTSDKNDFVKECYRLLKKDGRLVLSDFFQSYAGQSDPNNLLSKWGETWGVPHFAESNEFRNKLKNSGFGMTDEYDYTKEIEKSAKRLYYASLLGAIPSELYNLFHPNVSKFAKSHYKCGYYQYKALKQGLWKYKVIVAVK